MVLQVFNRGSFFGWSWFWWQSCSLSWQTPFPPLSGSLILKKQLSSKWLLLGMLPVVASSVAGKEMLVLANRWQCSGDRLSLPKMCIWGRDQQEPRVSFISDCWYSICLWTYQPGQPNQPHTWEKYCKREWELNSWTHKGSVYVPPQASYVPCCTYSRAPQACWSRAKGFPLWCDLS
jgi:hypothetical protein